MSNLSVFLFLFCSLQVRHLQGLFHGCLLHQVSSAQFLPSGGSLRVFLREGILQSWHGPAVNGLHPWVIQYYNHKSFLGRSCMNVDRQRNPWMDELMERGMNEWGEVIMNAWMYDISVWINRLMCGWMHRWMDGWTDGKRGKCMDG